MTHIWTTSVALRAQKWTEIFAGATKNQCVEFKRNLPCLKRIMGVIRKIRLLRWGQGTTRRVGGRPKLILSSRSTNCWTSAWLSFKASMWPDWRQWPPHPRQILASWRMKVSVSKLAASSQFVTHLQRSKNQRTLLICFQITKIKLTQRWIN